MKMITFEKRWFYRRLRQKKINREGVISNILNILNSIANCCCPRKCGEKIDGDRQQQLMMTMTVNKSLFTAQRA